MSPKNQSFVDSFEKTVQKTVEEHGLASQRDKVLVACSGGKDSTATLYLMKKMGYNVEAILLDLLIGEYSKKNLANITTFCREQDIKLHVVNYRKELGYSVCYIRSAIQAKEKVKNCHICGVLKKYLLNKKAREVGASKLVTGHNLDDEAQTFLMNVLHGNPQLSAGAGPTTGDIANKKFVARIKPLFFTREAEVRKYAELKGFPVNFTRCPCGFDAFRNVMRKVLNEKEKKDKKVKLKMVKQMLAWQPKLKKNMPAGELGHCRLCGEPSKQETCLACRLMGKVMA